MTGVPQHDAGSAPRTGPTVLFVAGNGRSGSTLLDRMLGQTGACVSTGELSQIWRRGVRDDVSCACGVRFGACGFWTAVGTSAFGGWDNIDAAAMVRLQRSVDRLRYVPLMHLRWLAPEYRTRLRAYGNALTALYAAVSQVAGRSIVVDSSKHVHTAFLLHCLDGIDLHLLHLVRDSRGVAYSWNKTVRKPDGRPDDAHMHRYSTAAASVQYLVTNSLLEVLKARHPTQASMCYEDLVRDPAAELARVLAAAGAPAAAARGIVSSGAVDLGESHSVGGNPMRFRTGRTVLVADDAWRAHLAPFDQRVVTCLTWPLLRRYRYLARD